MACGVCDDTTHNRRTCPWDAPRRHFSRSIPKSKCCECCGSYRYEVERHHSRGRGDNSPSAILDLCAGCHLDCAHRGNTSNIPVKPRICTFTGNDSHWRRFN